MKQLPRSETIIHTGIIGIIVNVVLSVFKAIVGLSVNSIAILLDAVNNLSDAVSSIITIAGAQLSKKTADRKHPLGYGRVEYLSAMLVSMLLIGAGGAALVGAIKKIISPSAMHYSAAALLIVGTAIAAKLFLGLYTKRKGTETDSDSLIASGIEALFDAAISLSTLISAIIAIVWNINIDGWLGAVISAVIIRAGLGILLHTFNDILGHRASSDLSNEIKEEILSYDSVTGVYDLFLDSFGPRRMAGSVHISVPDTMTAGQIHELTQIISIGIRKKFGAVITCGIYAVNSFTDERRLKLRKASDLLAAHAGVLDAHGLYVNEKEKTVSAHVAIDGSVCSFDEIAGELTEALQSVFTDCECIVYPVPDYSD